jgi:anti-anti-sigma factor
LDEGQPLDTALAGRVLAGVCAGDHVCCTFGADDEQQALVGRFAGDAMARDERLLYLADRSDEATVRGFVDCAGIDSARWLASGQLQIRSAGEVYEAPFDPERQIAHFEAETRTAQADGFGGLAVVGEMSWALRDGQHWESVARYEQEVQRVFAAGGVRGVCQYDRRLFSSDLLDEALAAHELAVGIDATLEGGIDGALAWARWRTATILESAAADAIRVSGELDLASGPYLAARLAEHLPGSGDIVIDADELSFVDISGCRALVQTAMALNPPRQLVIEPASAQLLRVLELSGWRELPGLDVRPARDSSRCIDVGLSGDTHDETYRG